MATVPTWATYRAGRAELDLDVVADARRSFGPHRSLQADPFLLDHKDGHHREVAAGHGRAL